MFGSTQCLHINNPRDGDGTDAPRDAEGFLEKLPPTPVYVDNKGTHATVNNPVATAQASKHLDIRFFKIRDHIRDKKLRVEFIRTHLNVADFFTIKNIIMGGSAFKNSDI